MRVFVHPSWLILLAAFALSALAADTPPPPEFAIKRQEIYEFTEKPTLAREGDRVTIRFASKAFCDATVAIEDSKGRIVRHLASGVLGANAPEPFEKNALKQNIVWDGKNDQGDYIDDFDALA